MPEVNEGYQPGKEEIQRAEDSMTDYQRDLTEAREKNEGKEEISVLEANEIGRNLELDKVFAQEAKEAIEGVREKMLNRAAGQMFDHYKIIVRGRFGDRGRQIPYDVTSQDVKESLKHEKNPGVVCVVEGERGTTQPDSYYESAHKLLSRGLSSGASGSSGEITIGNVPHYVKRYAHIHSGEKYEKQGSIPNDRIELKKVWERRKAFIEKVFETPREIEQKKTE